MDRTGRRIRRAAGWALLVFLGASLAFGTASARRHSHSRNTHKVRGHAHATALKAGGHRHRKVTHAIATSSRRHGPHARHGRHRRMARELAFMGYGANGEPRLRSRAAIVLDPDSNRVLFCKNEDQRMPIASLTKVMTALVLLDTGPAWDSVVTMTRPDIYQASHTRLRSGERILKRDLFQLSLMISDNAATRALVRSTGLPHERFVEMMNVKAKAMGLTGTHFVEETGLEPENISTARDYARLLAAACRNPMVSAITSTPHYEFRTSRGMHEIHNTDRLLYGNYDVMTGKTGFINEAGYCFATCVRAAGRPLVSVVLGAPTKGTRFLETMKLIDWASSRRNPLSARSDLINSAAVGAVVVPH